MSEAVKAGMTSLSRDLVFLILQFLDEKKFKETVHRLERDSGYYFNMKYFEEQVTEGNWDEVEQYLSGFTKFDDNRHSMKIYFEIRKQKYLEALDRHDRAKAADILVDELKVFSAFNEELYKEMTQLLALENFRENEKLSSYGDTKSARALVLKELKGLIEANPLFHDKLEFPNFSSSRLQTLAGQSLNWQNQLCKNPIANPDINSLFVDHSCQTNGCHVPSPMNNPLLGSIQKAGGYPPLATNTPFQPVLAPVPTSMSSWISNSPSVTHPAVSSGVIGLGTPTNLVMKHPRTPPMTIPILDHPPVGLSEENHSQPMHTLDDLPKTVARTLIQCSAPTCMDFHPIKETIVLVGTNVGEIGLWNVGSGEKLVSKDFKVWKIKACSMSLQNALAKDPGVSINSIIWSPNGSFFGVAYSRHIVQIYSYHGGNDVRQHLEIDAHIGGVNDLAFAYPKHRPCVITCGDDKKIKVWDATTGRKRYTFEGHEAPVYSVCPQSKSNVQFLFSTAIDGKIKAWMYDNLRSVVDYDAPGHSCTAMAYNEDGSRLFSCGTRKDGESYIVEWDENKGAVKRTYQGLGNRSSGVVQFDTTKNRFLAAGDEFLIKFWDMDNDNLLTIIDANGGLSESPRICFNKGGTLLAVSTQDNCIKILANNDGLCLLHAFETRSLENTRAVSETATKPIISPLTASGATSSGMTQIIAPVVAIAAESDDSKYLVDFKPKLTFLVNIKPKLTEESMDIKPKFTEESIDIKPKLLEDSMDKSNVWKLAEISKPSQCSSFGLTNNSRTNKISRLIYTNSGGGILALASKAIHLLWKWSCNERKSAGKATSITSLLWQPASHILMTNEAISADPEEVVPCFALSKNDCYVISACGGKISLFNMLNFKTMTTFMVPPPAATFLAFHPLDNNIFAIGMDDSTIQIYNVRLDKVESTLRGHSNRITGLAFSSALILLVSSDADAQIFVWGAKDWDKQRSKSLQIPSGYASAVSWDTCVQFHANQIKFLAVHKTQIAIYETTKLECVKQWIPPEGSAAISHATFSCDSQSVYVSFLDATVCVFSAANLRLYCRINPTAYLPANISSSVYPLVIAAHPSKPNQFALGLTHGGVRVLEPLESEGKWGLPPPENGSTSSLSTATPAGLIPSSDQLQL